MKTRIVYPQLWLDENFAKCTPTTKLLFCYLINNIQLGLTRYTHLSDRQMMFDTGLNTAQLEKAKQELTSIKWVFFTDGWVYHNHKCAYVDYDGRDRVITSKEEEIASVPDKVKDIINGLITGSEPVLNHKPEIINQKSEIGVVKGKEVLDDPDFIAELQGAFPFRDILTEIEKMKDWLSSNGKKKSDYKAFARNWLRNEKYGSNMPGVIKI